ncbi:MAG TPA: Ig-like domain-containing protein, partial [Armatimonadota bacterium]|nr:Ig-like domain-containing protein [Armatimonadota bacterium]
MSATRVFVILIIWSSLIAARAGAAVSISVEASPPIIPADGKSTGQILVTVLDQSGVPVGDDTEVRLTTSAGDITPAVYTTGGRAVGILTSSTCPQIATVNAIAGGASGSAQVEFSSADIEQAAASVRTIRVEGGSLAYAVDRDTILGTNNVTIEYKGLTIRAMSAQVCQASGQIRAQSKVSVQKGDETLTSDALALDTRGDRLRLLDFGDPAVARTFDVGKLTLIGTEDTQPDDQDFSPLINTVSKTWIVSGRLILIPGDRILFYKASVYVGESR